MAIHSIRGGRHISRRFLFTYTPLSEYRGVACKRTDWTLQISFTALVTLICALQPLPALEVMNNDGIVNCDHLEDIYKAVARRN